MSSSASSDRGPAAGHRRVRAVAAVSAVYDALVGVAMVAGRPILAGVFGTPLPIPPIHADLNGIFLLSIAAGYVITYREPGSRAGRTYLWLMGPWLKGAGATAFVLDYLFRGSPGSFLIFALSDGSLALLSLWALVTSPSADA